MSPCLPPSRYYQLTHDYLVPALRQWLTRKQRETRHGRAALRLEERAAFWSQRPESRQLPSLWEWINIRSLTRSSAWSPAQRQMMRRAGWFYASRLAVLFVLVGLLGLAAFLGWREQTGALKATGLVDQLAAAEIREVPRIVGELGPYRRWATPLLHQILHDHPNDAKRQLHARLALLPVDAGQVPLVLEQLLVADPEEVGVIRKELARHRQTVNDQLWPVLDNAQAHAAKRLRAASALAECDPDSAHWPRVAPGLAEILVKASPLQVGQWVDQMNPIRTVLLQPLAKIGRDTTRPDSERDLAVNLVSRYGADQPAVLAEFIRDIEPRYGAMVMPALQQAHDGQTIAWLVQQLDKRPGPAVAPAARARQLQQQANTAAMLVLLGQPDQVWPLLRRGPDPSPRTYLIHTLGPLGVGLPLLARRLEQEPDISARQALIQCLGEVAVEKSPPDARQALVDKLKQQYQDDPDPGIHSSIDWLLRRWGQGPELARMDRELTRKQGQGQRRWYVNTQGHTMAIILSPGKFIMGSPKNDPDRILPQEAPKVQPIVYSYAIATKEVTVQQFREFLHDYPNIMSADNRAAFERFNQDPTQPVRAVTWFEAAEYCRWLSDKEGVAPDQMCYPSVKAIDRAVRDPESERGIKLALTSLGRTGYRLPTEAEWEYACRAQAATSRFFGSSEEMLRQYGWYAFNSGSHPHPVGRLKPNDFLGNLVVSKVFHLPQGHRPRLLIAEQVEQPLTLLRHVRQDQRQFSSGPVFDQPPGQPHLAEQ